MRAIVDVVLKELSPQFDRLYSSTGRPSIAPEKVWRALWLQVLYTVRSERLLLEPLDYHLLCRWFVGLNMDDPGWAPSTFRKHRERLLAGDVAPAFFDQVLAQAREHDLLSDAHFTVDGPLIEAWARQKSFKPKAAATPSEPPDDPGNPSVDFRGERRTNAPHASTTDPAARLYKKAKGQEAKLSYLGHVLRENRHGLVADTPVTQATGTAEREAVARANTTMLNITCTCTARSLCSGATIPRLGQELANFPVAETIIKPVRIVDKKLKRTLPPDWMRMLGTAELPHIQNTSISAITQGVLSSLVIRFRRLRDDLVDHRPIVIVNFAIHVWPGFKFLTRDRFS
jgi:transposase